MEKVKGELDCSALHSESKGRVSNAPYNQKYQAHPNAFTAE